MLGVDGDQLGARNASEWLHHRAGGDEALLVGQGESLAGAQRGDGDGQAGEADDAVDHHVGHLGEIGEIGDHGAGRQRLDDRGALGRVGDRHETRAELLGLGDQRVDRRSDAERHHLVAVRFGAHDVEGLATDRARRAGDSDAGRAHERATPA